MKITHLHMANPTIENAVTNIITLFTQQALTSPYRIALVCNGEEYTYAHLHDESNRLAQLLICEYSIQQGDVVALMVNKDKYTYVSILAILKCGASYLPLSSEVPMNRANYIVKNSDAKLLICSSGIHQAAIDISKLEIENINREIDFYQPILPRFETDENTRACIFYTSGTTGNPNGVEILHRGVIRLVTGDDYFPFSEKQTILQISNLGFDAATFEIWGAWLNGHKLIAENSSFNDFNNLASVIQKYDIDTIIFTTSYFNLLVDTNIKSLTGLKYVFVAGEALSVSHIQKARQQYPDIVFINGYGPTECTTFSCCYTLPADFDFSRSSIPIGKAITRTQTFILDDNKQEIKDDSRNGELYIGGDGLAKGYLKNETLTNERFIEHPSNKQIRLYKTGDICKYDSNGNILYLGRVDNQLKIRGFRVETEEVEHLITKHPLVLTCSVCSFRSDISTELIAYIVTNSQDHQDGIDIAQLRKDITLTMPSYMIPSFIIEINQIPLTPNGKADKKYLIDQFRREQKIQSSNNPEFTNNIQKLIYESWRKYISIGSIDPDSSFFDLGGDSLQAVSLINDLNTCLNLKLSTLQLYKTPSINSMTVFLQKNLHLNTFNELIVSLKEGVGTPLVLAPGIDGDILTYIHFSRYFKKQNPIYCLNYPDPEELINDINLEKFATMYVDELIKKFKHKEFYFLGYSFGGQLIFEIVVQLKKQNFPTNNIWIVDSLAPGFRTNPATKKEKLLFEYYFFKHVGIKSKIMFVTKRLTRLYELKRTKKDTFKLVDTINEKQKKTPSSTYYSIFSNYYSSEKHSTNLTLIHSSPKVSSPKTALYYLIQINPLLFWEQNITGKIKEVEIKCNHHDFFKEKNVEEILRHIELEI